MRQALNILIVVLVLVFATAARATTWLVIPGGGGDATTIQAGIDLASDGDVVMVAPGTYTGPGNVEVTFGGKNIMVTSQAGAHFTIIDCENSAGGFQFVNGEGFVAVLEGFTIQNGSRVNGGAVYLENSSPTLRHNIFAHNNATGAGGALHIKGGSPTIHNNTIDDNGAPTAGGVWVEGPGFPSIYQNIVSNSTAGGAYGCNNANAFVACNNVYANVGGIGDIICAGNNGSNYSQDPLYCGTPLSGNYYLQQISPCSPAFSPCVSLVGALGVNCSVTTTEAVTWGSVKSMYR